VAAPEDGATRAEREALNGVTLRAVSANADFVKTKPHLAKAFDAAYQESVSLHPITGIEQQIAEALQFKIIARAPSAAALEELVVDTRRWR